MADNDKLSAKPSIDTTDFKSGIATMNRELRVLESGFRASAASLGDWAKDASGLELRIESLNKQMDVQKQKVAATRVEYEKIKAEKGENSKAAQDLEIKLNKETETLGKMENELGNTEAALQEMTTGEEEAGDAADDTANAVDDLGNQVEDSEGKIVSFNDVLSGMGDVAKIAVTAIAAIGAAAVGAVAGLSALVFSAADAAGELVDMSAKTGLSTTTLQELQYVGDQVGTSLDTITSSQARLIRSMNDATQQNKDWDEALKKSGKQEDEFEGKVGDMALAFNTLRVQTVDANGNLRDSEAVFNDVIDALGKVENPTERDALAMQIFGKSAQELNPLIKAGSEELNRLTQEAHDVGAVMSEDSVSGLEAFGDSVASIKAAVKGTLGTIAGQFAPLAQQIATGLQNLFKSDTFKRGLNEAIALIQRVVAVAGEVVSKLLSGDVSGALAQVFGSELANRIVTIATALNNFIQGTVIPFVTTHAKELKAAVIGIGAAFAAAGIISAILGIVAAINPVTLVIAAIAAAVGLLSAAWASNWGGIRDTVTQIWEGTIKPILSLLRDLIQRNSIGLQFWGDVWKNVLLPAIQAVWSFVSDVLFPLFQAIASFIISVFVVHLRTMSNIWQNVLLPAMQSVWNFVSKSLFPLLQAIGTFIGAVFNLALRVMAGLWQNLILPALQAIYGFLNDKIFPVFQKVGEYIQKTFQPILEKLGNFFTNKLTPAFSGISNAIQGVIQWLVTMADKLNNLQLPTWLTPGSPTPWEIGLVGISNAMSQVNKQLPQMAKGLQTVTLAGSTSSGAGITNQSNVQNDQFAFYAPVIVQGNTPTGSLGARLKGRRY